MLAVGQLLDAIADPANLARAWKRVRSNAGAAGIDGQSIAAFGADAEHQLDALRKRLLSAERYVPPPVLRVEIPKPDGRVRPLGIPTVADRVVQQATRQVIEPSFEPTFLACSFGYRPGKGAKRAAWWVREAIRRGDRWVAEFDIVGFFDHLRHPRLLREVAKEIEDPEVIGLIRRWLRAGVLTEAGVESTTTGTPQGGVISPLLANIYLHRLDVEVRAAGLRLIRYADDFVILTRTKVEALAADRLVRSILADIGLEVAEAKSGVRRVSEGFDFLGFTYHGRFLRPRPAALKRFKDAVRVRTRRQAPVSLRHMIEGLNPLLRGWATYFGIGDVVDAFNDLDKWIRMRLRSKVRGNKARQVSNFKLPNRVLAELGLVSLEAIARQSRLSPV
jgi:group II intron reverse transcriptase/maturase